MTRKLKASRLREILSLSLSLSASNLPSTLRVPRWAKVAGVGLLVAVSIGAVVYYLNRSGRLKFNLRL